MQPFSVASVAEYEDIDSSRKHVDRDGHGTSSRRFRWAVLVALVVVGAVLAVAALASQSSVGGNLTQMLQSGNDESDPCASFNNCFSGCMRRHPCDACGVPPLSFCPAGSSNPIYCFDCRKDCSINGPGCVPPQGHASDQARSTSAHVEAKAAKIADEKFVLKGFGIKSLSMDAYVTHSDVYMELLSNLGIYGVGGLAESERWDFAYFSGESGNPYYQIVHSHEDEFYHYLGMQSDLNPSIMSSGSSAGSRWRLARVDNGELATGKPDTGRSVSYYLVNVERNACLAITGVVVDPKKNDRETFAQKKNSVTGLRRDASGKFPAACQVQLVDGSQSTVRGQVGAGR